MFFEGNRIDAMREMILADSVEGRKKALAKILPYQKSDFVGMFKELQGLPATIRVGRYHSLCVVEVPACMEVTARSEDGLPMALRHRGLRMAGVQFHPDSFLTDDGPAMMAHALRGDF